MKPWLGRTPRAWQVEALPAIEAALSVGSRPVVVAATGTGKSVLMAELLAGRGPAVVVAPTEPLVEQLAETVSARLGKSEVGVYYGRKKQPDHRVVICCSPSLAGLVGRGRRGGLLVIDEAHRASEADRVREWVPRLEPEGVVGFSATPYLTDPARKLSMFDAAITACTITRALDDEVLCPYDFRRWKGKPLPPGGTDAIDAACIEMILGVDGPGIVTAATIPDAIRFAGQLSGAGIPSVAIHSKLRKREQKSLIEDLEAGRIRALVHVRMLTEGVDIPCLRWVCLREEIGSLVDFVQVVGRVLRTHPGKTEAIVLDPHLLGLQFRGLEHGARVGAQELDRALAQAVERAQEPAAPAPVVISPPVALGTVSEWLAGVLGAMERASIPMPERRAFQAGRPTRGEVCYFRKRVDRHWKVLPSILKATMRALAEAAEHATAADVSIATAVVGGCADYVDRQRKASGGWSYRYPDRLLAALPSEPPEAVVAALAGMRAPEMIDDRPLFFEGAV